MSNPIIENIAANIETAVSNITVANGYNYTLTGKRPKRIDFLTESWQNLDVIIQQGQCQSKESPYTAREWVQTFVLVAIVVGSDSDTTSIDTQKNQVVADIEKALMADTTRGGYAIDTEITERNFIVDDEAGGVSVNVDVLYRTAIENPYTQI